MFVFDKYSGELVEKLRRGLNDADEACSIQAVRGTQTAKWNGRTILLQFDVTYSMAKPEASQKASFLPDTASGLTPATETNR